MELAERDTLLRELSNKLITQRAILKRNMSLLKGEIGTNQVLANVLADYELSVDSLRKKKEDQVIYFELMNDYLDKISHDTDLTSEALIRAKDDQGRILEEMKKVKKELQELL